MARTVKELGPEDLGAMVELAQDLAQLSPALISRVEKSMAARFANDPRSYVFGQFEDERLVAWAHFKLWDESDGKAYTWGVTQRVKSALPLLNHACRYFEEKGVTTCYVMKPVKSLSSVIGQPDSAFKDYRWETVEVVKAGHLSSIPLMNKYVLTVTPTQDYEIGKMVK